MVALHDINFVGVKFGGINTKGGKLFKQDIDFDAVWGVKAIKLQWVLPNWQGLLVGCPCGGAVVLANLPSLAASFVQILGSW